MFASMVLMEVTLDNFTLTTIESIFRQLKDAEYAEVFETTVYLFNYVIKQKIYPGPVVTGFYSAMCVVANLSIGQFLQIKEIYR